MNNYAGTMGVIGTPPLAPWAGIDTVKKLPLGTVMGFTDPYWGGLEAIYLQMPASQAVKVGGILSFDVATSFLAALMANTAILGKAAAICANGVASSADAQYGWGVISGQFPIWSNASVAANTGIGVVAAGQGGAVAAGKSLNGCRVTLPATTTVAKTSTQTRNGSPVIVVPNIDGWFVGLAITGTGIAASSVITAIANDGRTVTLNNNCTADGSVTATGTYNDGTNYWNVATFDRVTMQGPIT